MRSNRKVKPKTITPEIIPVCIIFTLIFLPMFFFQAWCGVQCIRIGYAVTEALNTQQRLMDTQKDLKIERLHLRSPQRLMKLAKEKFELLIPAPDQMIMIP